MEKKNSLFDLNPEEKPLKSTATLNFKASLCGQTLLQYEILAKILDPTQDLYQAIDTKMQRKVTLLILAPDTPRELVARYESQAPVLAQINHPNVFAIYDFQAIEDRHFLSMEYMQAKQSLEDMLRERVSFDEKKAVSLLFPLCQGVGKLEELGFYGSLSPAQVMMDKAYPKVHPFALVNPKGLDPSVYMAPECLRGEKANVQSDIYSLGMIFATLLGMVSGKKKASSSSPLPSASKSKVSKEIAWLIDKMTRAQAKERFPDIPTLLQALDHLQKSWQKMEKVQDQKKIGKEFASLLTETKEIQKSARRKKSLAFVFICFLFAGLFYMMLPGKEPDAKVPGNYQNDLLWEGNKWARTCGRIVAFEPSQEAEMPGAWATLWDGKEEKRIFLSPSLLAAYPHEEIPLQTMISCQGKVNQHSEKFFYLEVGLSQIFFYQNPSLWVKMANSEAAFSPSLANLSGKEARLQGSLIQLQKTKDFVLGLLEDTETYQIWVQIHRLQIKIQDDLILQSSRITDILEAAGILEEKVEGEKRKIFLHVRPQEKNQFFRIRSVAPALQESKKNL